MLCRLRAPDEVEVGAQACSLHVQSNCDTYSCAAPPPPPSSSSQGSRTHMHINMQHTLSCSSAPPATAPLSSPPFVFIPHSRAHSLSAGWSCHPGESPVDQGSPSARGPCREPAKPMTTATTGACCPATGNKTSLRSMQRSESRWRWPVSFAW